MQAQSPTREFWVESLDRIARPAIKHLANDQLREKMPIEAVWDRASKTCYLEAFGRTLCGIAPWLELGADSTKEGQLRSEYIEMPLRAIDNATNPKAKDYMNFTRERQSLVDAAFMVHGLIRAKTQIWDQLSDLVKKTSHRPTHCNTFN